MEELDEAEKSDYFIDCFVITWEFLQNTQKSPGKNYATLIQNIQKV